MKKVVMGAAVAAGLFAAGAYDLAHAEGLALEAGAGMAYFPRIVKDNYWYQEPFPYEHDLTSASYRIGLTKQINKRWGIGLAYVHLGENGVTSDAIPHDEAYDACLQGVQGSNGCGHYTARFLVRGRAHGLEASATYMVGEHLYLRGGALVWFHDLDVTVIGHTPGNTLEAHFSGVMLAPTVGAGVRYGPLFAEVSYYHSFGSSGFPIATRAVVPLVGARISF